MVVDEAALVEVLEDSLEDSTPVAVTVGVHEFKCCGGGWQRRYEQTTYTGRVLSISVEEFLLQCGNQLGKMSEVIARYEDLVAAALVD